MKTLALIGLLAAGLLTMTGCGTPGYNPEERNAVILRNYSYDGAQMVDDFDNDVIMSRPASRLTHWDVD